MGSEEFKPGFTFDQLIWDNRSVISLLNWTLIHRNPSSESKDVVVVGVFLLFIVLPSINEFYQRPNKIASPCRFSKMELLSHRKDGERWSGLSSKPCTPSLYHQKHFPRALSGISCDRLILCKNRNWNWWDSPSTGCHITYTRTLSVYLGIKLICLAYNRLYFRGLDVQVSVLSSMLSIHVFPYISD